MGESRKVYAGLGPASLSAAVARNGPQAAKLAGMGSARRTKKALVRKVVEDELSQPFASVVDQRPSTRVWGFGKVLPANSHECNPVVMLCVLSSWAPVGTIHGVQTSGRAAAGAHVVAPRIQAADAAASSTWSLFSRDKVCADATLW